MPEDAAQRRQMLGSLLVALVIVAVAIVVVTARIGPTSAAEQETIERVEKERTDQLEERLDQREEERESRERR
jgi:uncharacterized membrane-anchored protein YhcB (DUF1043 family)